MKNFEAHALDCYPDEACALVFNDKVHIVENVHRDKGHHFKVAARATLEALNSRTGLQMVIHSHPHPHNRPSPADIDCQVRMGCPFAIVTTNGKEVTDYYEWEKNSTHNLHE